VDTNLIQLDTEELGTSAPTYADNDDDLIFEVRRAGGLIENREIGG
jgi:hypothetical protein